MSTRWAHCTSSEWGGSCGETLGTGVWQGRVHRVAAGLELEWEGCSGKQGELVGVSLLPSSTVHEAKASCTGWEFASLQ